MGRWKLKQVVFICAFVYVFAAVSVVLWRRKEPRDIIMVDYSKEMLKTQLPRSDFADYHHSMTKAGVTWIERTTISTKFPVRKEYNKTSLSTSGKYRVDMNHFKNRPQKKMYDRTTMPSNSMVLASENLPQSSQKFIYQRTYNQTVSMRRSLSSLRDRFPRIMIIGIGKTATKSLFDVLKARPDLVGLDLERRFFTKNYDNNIHLYLGSFPRPPIDGFVIEKSPDYFYHVAVPKRIKIFAKTLNIDMQDIKFVVVLRDPIERAQEEYMDWGTKRWKKSKTRLKPFHDIIVASNGAISKTQPFIKKSYYSIYINHWLSAFNLSKTCFVDGNILASNPFAEFKLLEKCLKLKSIFRQSDFFKDSSDEVCYKTSKARTCTESLKKVYPDMPPLVRKKLQDYYRPMVNTLSRSCKRNFVWSNF